MNANTKTYAATDTPASDEVPAGFERISLVEITRTGKVCYQVEASDGDFYLCDGDGDKINDAGEWMLLRVLADVPADDPDAFFEAIEASAMRTEVAVPREAIQDAIRQEYCDLARTGQNWHFVRVWPDGTVSHGAEVSECVPESEYYRKGNPYPVTVWTQRGTGAPFAEHVFEMEPCDESEAEFFTDEHGDIRDEKDERHPLPGRLTDSMIEDLDWKQIMPEVEAKLIEAGYTPGE